MAGNINEFRLKLLEKIQNAPTEDGVIRLVDTAFRTLTENNVHGHIIMRFLDKLILDIEQHERNNEKAMFSVTATKKIRAIKEMVTMRSA